MEVDAVYRAGTLLYLYLGAERASVGRGVRLHQG